MTFTIVREYFRINKISCKNLTQIIHILYRPEKDKFYAVKQKYKSVLFLPIM